VAGSCDHGNKPLGCIKDSEFLDELSDHKFVKKQSPQLVNVAVFIKTAITALSGLCMNTTSLLLLVFQTMHGYYFLTFSGITTNDLAMRTKFLRFLVLQLVTSELLHKHSTNMEYVFVIFKFL
jgi:hypothetical protein